jgi:two-component system chemotaxis response regulator CheY
VPGSRALIVDDSRATQTALARIVEPLGFACVLASHGAEALARLDEHDGAFAFALVDWNMPVMDGFTFVKTIRAQRRHAALPVVMVSAEIDRRMIARALMASADEYVMKPFDREVLVEKLSALGLADGG